MKVYTAPEYVDNDYPIIFLAGGITNCSEWQKEVIDYFKNKEYPYVFCNPRRDNFTKAMANDHHTSYDQIKWEFDCLDRCDIFTMYFDYTEKSDQPICFYELGRNICRMQERFPDDWWKRIVITCHKGFKRVTDVRLQTYFATEHKVGVDIGSIENHIESIEYVINSL